MGTIINLKDHAGKTGKKRFDAERAAELSARRDELALLTVNILEVRTLVENLYCDALQMLKAASAMVEAAQPPESGKAKKP